MVSGDSFVVLLRYSELVAWSFGDLFDSWYSIAEVEEDKANLAFRLL